MRSLLLRAGAEGRAPDQTRSLLPLAATLLVLAGCAELPDSDPLEHANTQALESVPSTNPVAHSEMTPKAFARLQRSLDRSPENLRVHTRPDGLHDVEVLSGFQHATLVVRQPDGTFGHHCTSDADHAAQLLTRKVP